MVAPPTPLTVKMKPAGGLYRKTSGVITLTWAGLHAMCPATISDPEYEYNDRDDDPCELHDDESCAQAEAEARA